MNALESLGRQLGDGVEQYARDRKGLVRPAAASPRPPAVRRRASRPRSRVLAVAAVALIIAAAVLQVLPDGASHDAQAAPLPVLARADREVSGVPRLPQAAGDDMDLHHGYAFAFGTNTAYVLTSRDRRTICLVLPDPPAGFGSTCETVATVKRHGLVATLVAPSGTTAPSRIAVVIPDGVPAPEIQYRDGRRVRLPVTDGVATASILGDGTLTVTAQDGSRRVAVHRQEPEGEQWVDCGDGHVVKVTDPSHLAIRNPPECRS
jgi:hypothetical protein